MSPINTAYKGDFLSWTINLVESRVLVIADVFLDRLAFVAGALPLLERVVVLPTGARGRPGAVAAARDPGRADGRPRRRARRRRARVDGRRPDHVHVRHHRPLEGRHQAARRRLLLGAERDRGDGDAARRRAGRPARRDLLLVPAALPLERAGALRLPGAAGRRAGGVRGALLGHALLAAGDRRRAPPRSTGSARSSTSSGTSRRRSWTGPIGCTRSRRRRRRRTSTTSSRSASACASRRATASPRPASRR